MMPSDKDKGAPRRKNLLVLGCTTLTMATALLGPLSDSRAETNSNAGSMVSVSLGTTGITAGIWPIMVGVKKGMFQRHGVDLEIVPIQSASVNVQDLISGNMQFVSAGANSVILPVAHGADLAIIAGIENLFVGRLIGSKNVSSMQDLKGKVLSVSRRNGPDAAIMIDMLAAAGIRGRSCTVFNGWRQFGPACFRRKWRRGGNTARATGRFSGSRNWIEGPWP